MNTILSLSWISLVYLRKDKVQFAYVTNVMYEWVTWGMSVFKDKLERLMFYEKKKKNCKGEVQVELAYLPYSSLRIQHLATLKS